MGLGRALLVALVFVPGVSAAEVLLERISEHGNTPEEYAASSRCTIDESGQLAIHYRLAGLDSSRVQQLQIPLAAIRANIRTASGGKVTTESFAVDAETWIYRAWKRANDGSYRQVTLLEENGGSGQKLINDTPEARKLKSFLDLNCSGALRF